MLLIRNEKIVKLLEENADLKANPGNCHLLVNTTVNIRISVRKETVSGSLNQKQLGIRFDSNFGFDDHVPSFCIKTSQKLNALTRVEQYMNLAQRRSIIKAFHLFSVWILSIGMDVSQ